MPTTADPGQAGGACSGSSQACSSRLVAVRSGACAEAAVGLQVLPTQLIPDEKEGKVLRVRMIQKETVKRFAPAYLFDEGSTISWIPCGRKLTCSFPGIKFFYGPDTYFGEEVGCPAPSPSTTLPAQPQAVCSAAAYPVGAEASAALSHAAPTACDSAAVARCLFWRWTASSRSWRSSYTWRATSATHQLNSTARSRSRCSKTAASRGPRTAPASSRPLLASRSGKSLSRSGTSTLPQVNAGCGLACFLPDVLKY